MDFVPPCRLWPATAAPVIHVAMGRAKGKGRKENIKPFLASVRIMDAGDEGPAVLAIMKVSVTLDTIAAGGRWRGAFATSAESRAG